MYAPCNHYYNQYMERFLHPRKFPCTLVQSVFPSTFDPRPPLICFLSLQISLHFLEFHTNDIIPRYAFVSHLLSIIILDVNIFSFCFGLYFSYLLFPLLPLCCPLKPDNLSLVYIFSIPSINFHTTTYTHKET